HKVGSLALEFSGKGTALFGHLTPRSGEHSRLNGCPVSLDHYKQLFTLSANRIDDEDRYYRLLRSADDMEREGLMTNTEWLKLAQQAGTLFSSTAECMAGPK
ncbi:hypothetical protein, partial [Pseudomonas gregormendelii]|uniref:hypothetical protein n=1 Tax=Pseudomonas gregormendelii TaxID=1628277 RepID=UPI00197F11D6